MEWHATYPKEKSPTLEQVENYVNNPLWNKLNESIKNYYAIEPKVEYSGCSMQPGWNIKFKKSGKSLCTLYPMKGYFIALVVIGSKEMDEAEVLIPLCSEYVQSVFYNTKAGNGQKWLMIDVKSESTIEDILSLIALRVRPKNKLLNRGRD